jgi:RNA polymerase sigma-70 factor, ECF subfamily
MSADTRNTDEFMRLFSLYSKNIYSYITILVPSRVDAEDLFQETNRTLWTKFDKYRAGPDENFRAWALRIAQLTIMNYRKREKLRRRLFSDQVYDCVNEAAMVVIDSVEPRFDALFDCCRKLPDQDRRLIAARYHSGATVEAISDQTGQSVHSVYRALRRIHQWLFECIQEFRQTDEQISPDAEDRKS